MGNSISESVKNHEECASGAESERFEISFSTPAAHALHDEDDERMTRPAKRLLKPIQIVCLTMGFCCGAAGGAAAQTTTQFPIQFDFLNPGARSLAMGSA